MSGSQEAESARRMMERDVAQAREKLSKMQAQLQAVDAKLDTLLANRKQLVQDLGRAGYDLGKAEAAFLSFTSPLGYGGAPGWGPGVDQRARFRAFPGAR